MKRALVFIFIFAFLQVVSAIDLEIEKEVVNEIIIKELNNKAVFDFSIKNLGNSDDFELYSLVGVDIVPKEAFRIGKGETKKVRVEVEAWDSVKKISGYFNFVYKIKGSDGIQEDTLRIRLVSLKDVLELSADSINPYTDETTVYIKNRENYDFQQIEAEFSSAFFSFEENFSLPSLEAKEFPVSVDKEKLSSLIAGPYILDAALKINGIEGKIESTINFLEKSGLVIQENKEGWLIARHEIEKKNEGNVVTVAQITIEKNVFSRFITSFNIPPDKKEREGITSVYTWQKELRPGESLKVIVRTSWLILIILIVIVIVLILLYRKYLRSSIVLRKKVNFVKTKGGEFALKVTLTARARKFIEKVSIIDKLPPAVKLYERFGAVTPDKIDEKNRRIEWNIESLEEGEDRVFSYIIYSKIGIVGRFELPPARIIYEKEGRIREDSSNRVFFISEKKKIKKIEEED